MQLKYIFVLFLVSSGKLDAMDKLMATAEAARRVATDQAALAGANGVKKLGSRVGTVETNLASLTERVAALEVAEQDQEVEELGASISVGAGGASLPRVPALSRRAQFAQLEKEYNALRASHARSEVRLGLLEARAHGIDQAIESKIALLQADLKSVQGQLALAQPLLPAEGQSADAGQRILEESVLAPLRERVAMLEIKLTSEMKRERENLLELLSREYASRGELAKLATSIASTNDMTSKLVQRLEDVKVYMDQNGQGAAAGVGVSDEVCFDNAVMLIDSQLAALVLSSKSELSTRTDEETRDWVDLTKQVNAQVKIAKMFRGYKVRKGLGS